MCGRFSLRARLNDILAQFAAEAAGLDDMPLFERYNIPPTADIPVVRAIDGDRQLSLMRWGLVPPWTKDIKKAPMLNNARAERTTPVPVYDHSGKFLVQATLDGPGVTSTNNTGLWMSNGTDLRLVARTGDPAPGTEPGVVFDGFSTGNYALNAHGQVAFFGFLRGPGIDPNLNDRGIWAETPGGQLTLIARRGDYFTDGLGGTIRLDGLQFDKPGFGTSGYVAFKASLFGTNTSGVYVSNLVAVVPEPGSIALAVIGLVALAITNRSRSSSNLGI